MAAIKKLLKDQNRFTIDNSTGADTGVSLNEMLIKGSLEFEPPNKNIHNFIGVIGLEPTTPGPPDQCATDCATPRNYGVLINFSILNLICFNLSRISTCLFILPANF